MPGMRMLMMMMRDAQAFSLPLPRMRGLGYACIFLVSAGLNSLAHGLLIGNSSTEICNKVGAASHGVAQLRAPTITLDNNRYLPGVPLTVRVELNSRFRAVLLRARRVGGVTPVGTFSHAPLSTVYSCVYQNDTLMYQTDNSTTLAAFTWRPPDEESDTIVFVADVYQSEQVHWRNVTSFHVTKGFKPIDVSTCGESKGCFRFAVSGESCTFDDCDYVVTYTKSNDHALFEISAKAQWAAIGFSSDRLMGGDDVLLCLRRDHTPTAERAINKYSHQAPSAPDTHPELRGVEAQYVDGRISCRLERRLKVPAQDSYTVDLSGEWYQLYSWGDMSRTGTLKRHTLTTPPTSSRPLYLTHHNNVVSAAQKLMTSHISGLMASVVISGYCQLIPWR